MSGYTAAMHDARREREAMAAQIGQLAEERDTLRGLAEQLAAALALALYEGHPTYGSTAGWRGGVGGQTVTAGCSFIDPPPGVLFTQMDMLSKPLRAFLEAHPFDLNKAKVDLREELERDLRV